MYLVHALKLYNKARLVCGLETNRSGTQDENWEKRSFPVLMNVNENQQWGS